jgi:N-acyl homoserine lactone hydrolase
MDIDRMHAPVGFAVGSEENVVMTTEATKSVGHEARRVIPVHEELVKVRFALRIMADGLRVTEICLAAGERSRVN